MKNNRSTTRLPAFILAVAMFCCTFTGCARELTEKQSAALVALQSAVTYYETNGDLAHWEELVALAAANRADGIGVNWDALTLPDTPEVSLPPEQQATWAPIDIASYPGAIFSSILKGEDYASAKTALIAGQNPENGAFSESYINQHVWAMITLNAAVGQDGYDYEKAAAYLLTYQTGDGGFSYSAAREGAAEDSEENTAAENIEEDNRESDMDLTGAAAIALAPYYEKNRRTDEMKALTAYFKNTQLESGGYAGFSGENPSTIAAAIWGLSALKQELPATEDGLTPVDALLAYQNENGSFRSQQDGEHVFDSFSTRQAMIALSDVVNDVETYLLLAEDAESYRIEHISGPAITLTIDFPEESGLEDVSAPITVEAESSALDALLLYGKLKEIPVAFSGGSSSGYVESIGGVAEKDYGETSGWTYTVNGEAPQQSASAVILQEGDILSWVFVTDINETIIQ